ncbi:MAG: superoxide dismutase, partial [Thiomicrorhabdus sp.]|nr:superoxide dismutase [Thiomicrorhabdus sp.]
MAFTLSDLPYDYDALEVSIDARTMEIHHTKHHNAYVTNLNNAVADTPLADSSLDELIAKAGTLPPAVR